MRTNQNSPFTTRVDEELQAQLDGMRMCLSEAIEQMARVRHYLGNAHFLLSESRNASEFFISSRHVLHCHLFMIRLDVIAIKSIEVLRKFNVDPFEDPGRGSRETGSPTDRRAN